MVLKGTPWVDAVDQCNARPQHITVQLDYMEFFFDKANSVKKVRLIPQNDTKSTVHLNTISLHKQISQS